VGTLISGKDREVRNKMGRRNFRGHNKRLIGKRCAICLKVIENKEDGVQLSIRNKETRGKEVAFCNKCHQEVFAGINKSLTE